MASRLPCPPPFSQLFIVASEVEWAAIQPLLTRYDTVSWIAAPDAATVTEIPSHASVIIVADAVVPTPQAVKLLNALRADGRLRCPVVLVVPGLNAGLRKTWLERGGPELELLALDGLSAARIDEAIENAAARFELASAPAARADARAAAAQCTHPAQWEDIGSWEWYRTRDVISGSIGLYRIFGLDPALPFPALASQRGTLYAEADHDRLAHAVGATLHDGRPFQLALQARRHGEPIRIVVRAEPMRDTDGGIAGLRGTVQDITRHGAALDSLLDSEERLRLATTLAGVAFWDVDLLHDTLLWPPSLKAMFGVSPEQAVSMTDFYAGLHPDDRDATIAAFDAACDPHRRALYDVEYRTIGREDGVLRWVAAKGRGVFDENGRCVRVLGTAIDISRRKRAEEARLDSEARLRVVTDNARVGLVVVGVDRRYRFANRAYAEILGLPSAEIVGQSVADVLPAVYEQQIAPRLLRAFAGELVVYELVVPPRDGMGERMYAVTYQPSRQNDGASVVLVVIYDVTEREHAKRQAERGRQLLQAFVESVPGVVYAKDREGRMLIANRGTTELIGKPQADYLGKTDAEFLENRAQGEAIMANDRRIMLSGQPEQVEEEVRLSNGENAIWLSTKMPLLDERGEVTGLVGSSIDITARKSAEARLRDSEAALRLFADAMPNLAWMGNADGSPFWHNRRWHDYTGVAPGDLADWRAPALHDPALWPEVERRWSESIRDRASFEMSFPLRGADGVTRPFLTRIVPMHDAEGQVTRWFGTHTDVSPERAAQDKLAASEAALREADRRKDEFLATLAHELRNPLAPVLTASSLLASTNLAPEKLVWASQIIRRQVQHMARLLDDLLDVARITRGKLELKPEVIVLRDVVDMALETVRTLLERKHHVLTLDLPPQPISLLADPVRVAQVISNLLSNAAKYTNPNGRIRLAAQVQGDVLELCVTDNGIGLPPQAAEHIFTMFAQVTEGSHRSEGGLGIGLSLCKGLAELHGGRIDVASAGPGRGSTFTVRLPLGTTQPALASAGHAAGAELPRLRVMIADDNQDAADTLGALVDYEGHEVRVAHGGRAALTLAATFRPDVAVLDIGMPDLDGHAVARALREEPWAAGIRLIALTGWGQEEDRRKTAAAGFDFHLTKPVNPVELTALLVQPGKTLDA